MKYVYMVSVKSGENMHHVLTYSVKVARKWAKDNAGSIHRLSYGYFKDCHFCMDAPTFYAVSECILAR